MDYAGLKPLKLPSMAIRAAVWLQAKVCERGLELRLG